MFTINETNFKYVYHALRLKNTLEGKEVKEIKVNLNKAYLDRLNQFIQEIDSNDRLNFVQGTIGKFEKYVAYPLARKAFNFILEIIEDNQEISTNADKEIKENENNEKPKSMDILLNDLVHNNPNPPIIFS